MKLIKTERNTSDTLPTVRIALLETSSSTTRHTAGHYGSEILRMKTIPSFTWTSSVQQPSATLLCIHGLGLHGGVYRSFGERMSRFGVNTCALDVRGFGCWNNENLSCLDLLSCLNDIHEHVMQAKNKHPDLPIFLFGESMGGAIATQYVAAHDSEVAGLIVCAPATKVTEHKRELLSVAMQALCNPNKPVELSQTIIARAPHLVAPALESPSFRMQFTLRELLHMTLFFHGTTNCANRIKRTPVLVVQGDADRTVTTRSSMEFFENLATRDKQLLLLGHLEHLIFQTKEVNGKAIALVRIWIEQHVDFESALKLEKVG